VSCLFLFYLALAVGQATSPPTPQQIPQSESSVQTGSHADISILRTKAEAGDAVAQFQLGKAYETGNGTPQNDELAVNWYRKAAEQGNPAAENSLGVMFRLGRGVEKNQEEAVRWYRKAAKLGSPEAMFNLGAAHYNGDGAADNSILACAWFLLAQEGGNPAAQDAVRRCAAEMGRLAAVDAIIEIGEMYEKGEDLPQSYSEAARWYRKGAAESPEAAMRLATVLMNGIGVKRDYGEVMAVCLDAAKKRYSPAEVCVAYLYRIGLGVAPDPKEAAKWYREAALQGHIRAELTLAEMYIKGRGC